VERSQFLVIRGHWSLRPLRLWFEYFFFFFFFFFTLPLDVSVFGCLTRPSLRRAGKASRNGWFDCGFHFGRTSIVADRRELLLLSEKRISVSSCLLLCSSTVEMQIY